VASTTSVPADCEGQDCRDGYPTVDRRRALMVLAGVLALDIGSLNVVNAALPGIGHGFRLSSGSLQWVMTAYAATFAGCLLFGGRLADVFGRRRILTLGVSLFVFAACICALAPSAPVLVVARGVQGLGAALSVPAALALIGELFPEGPARHRALSIYAAVAAAAGSSGFVLGGVLTDTCGWRSVFAFSIVVGLAILVPIRSSLPADMPNRGGVDFPGAALVTAGLVLTVFGASHGAESGWRTPQTCVALVMASLFFLGFAGHERRAPDPLLPPLLWRMPGVQTGIVAGLALSTAAFGLQFFAPLYLQQVEGFSPIQSGFAMAPFSLIIFITATALTGRLVARHSPRLLLTIGLLLIGGGVGAWVSTGLVGRYWVEMLPGVVLAGIGVGLVFPTMSAAGLTGVPEPLHGVAGAVNVAAQQVGASVGVALLTIASARPGAAVAAQLAGYHHAYLAAGFVCVLGAGWTAAFGRTVRRPGNPTGTTSPSGPTRGGVL
jgi:MFS family permease